MRDVRRLTGCALALSALGCGEGGLAAVQLSSAPVDLSGIEIASAPTHPKLDGHLMALTEGVARHERRAGERVRVEVELTPGAHARSIPERDLTPYDARLTVRGTTRLELMLPPERALDLAEEPWVAFVRIPMPPVPATGPSLSAGVAAARADDFHCRDSIGQGIGVALVDVGFAGFDNSVASGELPNAGAAPFDPFGVENHGTQCAEVVADVAPGVYIEPIIEHSTAVLEALIDDLPNANLHVISRSLGSYWDAGFGDGTGRLCELATEARAQGVVWVNAAGNSAGAYYEAEFTDADGDGWHEMLDGDEMNRFDRAGGDMQAVLMWDDFPASARDLDLMLFRKQGGQLMPLVGSGNPQTGTQRPVEWINLSSYPAGEYGLGIRSLRGSGPIRMRLFLYGGTLGYQHAEGSLTPEGACADVIAVGALPVTNYTTGPVAYYSSRGPTTDGRIKPDIAGPSHVATSMGSFGGTSAATPHVAGALALYMNANGHDANDAVARLLADAIPMLDAFGTPAPNNTFGWGRLSLDALGADIGWECGPGMRSACDNTCGGVGQAQCALDCTWSNVCEPAAEQCNGVDDDCDGRADEGFICTVGATRPCTTACGTTGAQRCTDTCRWDACDAPCTLAVCGNGELEQGEVCDHGEHNDDAVAGACRTDCQGTVQGCGGECPEPVCGNGIVEGDEVCDAGEYASDTRAYACKTDCSGRVPREGGDAAVSGGCAGSPSGGAVWLLFATLAVRRWRRRG